MQAPPRIHLTGPLVYEVWFYAIFGTAFFLKVKMRWVVTALLCYLAGWRTLLMLAIWLTGVGLARHGAGVKLKG